ncbi:MAG TPA: SMC family ATPase [Pseudonocardiaceae bacterium]|jgi:exonuclease SbcC|nr:SMC family ATPase [Pseudonocardiaceae bacterium]
MRPVRLEMTGFASFRETTTMSFADADYFALVGPTGAGKSTVIDALTFALYGSVARWDREGLVSPALAPTINRGTVRLLFDIAGARYSVVRELRRSSGKQQSVNVRSVRLERLHDPHALSGPADTTELIAADSAVTPEVEKLLGLTFKHFCTCVALPQGAFAEFLHATAAERQKILMKLLGLEVYERIHGRANESAKQQSERAKVLAEQLDGHTDSTEERLTRLADRLKALTDLSTRVDAALPDLRTATAEHERARGRVATLTEERELLSSVGVPDGIGDLEATRQSTEEAGKAAAAAVTVAEQTESRARAALRAGPDRHALERVRADWRQLSETAAALPGLDQHAKDAEAECDAARRDEAAADALTEQARENHLAESSAARETIRRVEQARGERDLLAAVRVPEDLASIARAAARSEALTTGAADRLDKAEQADRAARGALAAQPDGAELSTALEHAKALAAFCTEHPAELTALDEKRQQLAKARVELDKAEQERAEAQRSMDAAGRTDQALALRAHLHIGAPCPVCEQQVTALPTQETSAQLRQSRERLDLAEKGLRGADRTVRERERAVERHTDAHTSAIGRAEQHRAALATASSIPALPAVLNGTLTLDTAPTTLTAMATAIEQTVDALTSALKRRSDLVTKTRSADKELAEAREARAVAQREAERIEQATNAARARLRAARDPVVALGAPPVDEVDLGAGWRQLAAWTTSELAGDARRLADLEASATERAARLDVAVMAFADAESGAKLARARTTAAGLAEQKARTRLEDAAAARETLAARLADAPSDESAQQQLKQVAQLQQAVDTAEKELGHARSAAALAAKQTAEVQGEVARARRNLALVRDPLVRFGAPPADDTDLRRAWSTLTRWANEQTTAHEYQLQQEKAAAERLATAARDSARAIVDDLSGHEVTLDSGRALQDIAAVAVAAEIATATAAHDNMVGQLAIAAKLTKDIADATEQSQVAKQLANLMRSNQFPRWLVASALDTLVAEASVSLMELSGGQFELTHAGGDFLVIDHNEADIARPVKTLSGGETFQASLALALALSSQLGTLAAAGATQLESIFLDEGFGTLDEATLDTVAATLENLAGSGSRMVGVITHVAALAERVPVRFQVRRDANGSHILREDT